MADLRKASSRRSRSSTQRVTFSNVEEIQFAGESASIGFEVDGGIDAHSDGSYRY